LKAKPDVVKGQRAGKTGPVKNVQASSQVKSENDDKKAVIEVWFHFTCYVNALCFW